MARPATFGPGRLLLRGLIHHRRAHLGSALGAAVACTVLTGALIIGDSVRESLRSLARDRLGKVDLAVLAGRPFPAELAGKLAARPEIAARLEPPAGVLILSGSGSAPRPEGGGLKTGGVSVIGVDAAGLDLLSPPGEERPEAPRGRSALVNRRLADDLGLKTGDPLVLRVAAASKVPRESLAGKREDASRSIRFEVAGVIPDRGAGRFSLAPDQRVPRLAIVDLEELSRAVLLKGRVNALLFRSRAGEGGAAGDESRRLIEDGLRAAASTEDLGLKVTPRPDRGFIQVESESFQIDPAVEKAVEEAAGSLPAPATAISTYLASTIPPPRPDNRSHEVPYSTVAALDPSAPAPFGPLVLLGGQPAPVLGPGEILLGEWAQKDLNVVVGEQVALEYLLVGRGGEIETARTSFEVRGVVADSPASVDPSLTPDFPGLTTAVRIGDWDPPFPVDLKRIRPVDEEYWKAHRAAPKAFISLAEGRRLWGSRFGAATAVRVAPPAGESLAEAEARLRSALREKLDPKVSGLAVRAVREEADRSARGSTDFSELFLGFSFFLIAAAGLLAGLFWAIGIERRAREWGILRATGFSGRAVRRLAGVEGLLVCGVGELIGLAAAPVYSWLLLEGLRVRWIAAMRPPRLDLHIEAASLVIGPLAALAVVLLATFLAARRIASASPRSLLGGSLAPAPAPAPPRSGRSAGPEAAPQRRLRITTVLAAAFLLAAGLLTVPAMFSARYAERAGPGAFFGAGAAILTAGLVLFAASLRGDRRSRGAGARVPGRASAVLWLGLRNARRHRGRSILTAALMASAAFVIAATAAMQGGEAESGGIKSGTGGFEFVARTDIPIFRRPDLASARADLGVPAAVDGKPVEWEGVEVISLRVREGDDSSCLNLYQTRRPRLLGAPPELIARGGFRFHATLAGSAEEAQNPWLLLQRPPGGASPGAVPAIADEATATWALHLALGDELEIEGSHGSRVKVKLVALLEGSILQGSLIVSDADFLSIAPAGGGWGAFLIGGPEEKVQPVIRALADGLDPYGFEAVPTARVLEEYQSVERAYLQTFQLLGGMGLLLGTAGLGAVLLRGALERRGELALLRAVGYRRSSLLGMVVSENALLLLAGLGIGSVAALAASAPHFRAGASPVPWLSLGLLLLGAAAVGLLAGLGAAATVVRSPLIPALRSE